MDTLLDRIFQGVDYMQVLKEYQVSLCSRRENAIYNGFEPTVLEHPLVVAYQRHFRDVGEVFRRLKKDERASPKYRELRELVEGTVNSRLPLAKLGLEQAEIAAPFIGSLDNWIPYCSRMLRAQESLVLLWSHLGCSSKLEGFFETSALNEVPQAHPKDDMNGENELDDKNDPYFQQAILEYAPSNVPNAESLYSRRWTHIMSLADWLREYQAGKFVYCMGHGLMMQSARIHYEHISSQGFDEYFSNGAIEIYSRISPENREVSADFSWGISCDPVAGKIGEWRKIRKVPTSFESSLKELRQRERIV